MSRNEFTNDFEYSGGEIVPTDGPALLLERLARAIDAGEEAHTAVVYGIDEQEGLHQGALHVCYSADSLESAVKVAGILRAAAAMIEDNIPTLYGEEGGD